MIVTLCGSQVNEADCGYCLQSKDCREVRETICIGCIRESACPPEYKRKKAEMGMCRGRELESTQMRTSEKEGWIDASIEDITKLHGKGF